MLFVLKSIKTYFDIIGSKIYQSAESTYNLSLQHHYYNKSIIYNIRILPAIEDICKAMNIIILWS